MSSTTLLNIFSEMMMSSYHGNNLSRKIHLFISFFLAFKGKKSPLNYDHFFSIRIEFGGRFCRSLVLSLFLWFNEKKFHRLRKMDTVNRKTNLKDSTDFFFPISFSAAFSVLEIDISVFVENTSLKRVARDWTVVGLLM